MIKRPKNLRYSIEVIRAVTLVSKTPKNTHTVLIYLGMQNIPIAKSVTIDV